MSAGEFQFKIFKISILLSLMMTTIESKICTRKLTEEMLVKKNGHMEKVPINRTVRICCEGYTIDKTNPSKCVSICSEGFIYENGKGCLPRCDECENGTCLAPHECQCEDDYVAVKSGCAPRCENECKNGYCVKPGKCGCNEGYIPTLDDSECVPICENCENGFCKKPHECQCKPGYKWNVQDFKCRPKCKKPCEHGYCSAPDQCSCHKGYRHSSLNVHICVPESNGYYDSTDNVGAVKSAELPEMEGFFRYSGRKIHFFGYFEGSEEDTTYTM